MPVIYQHRIYRRDLRANPEAYYVFGDNVIRKGYGGQAAEIRGEPNSIGIATKWGPGVGPEAYFTDQKYDTITSIIQKDLNCISMALKQNKIVVFPSDGVGTGLALLEENAPKVLYYLNQQLQFFGIKNGCA